MSHEEGSASTPPGGVRRRLAAILHADVKGYSRLLGEDEVATLRTLGSHLTLMRSLVQQHGGRAVGSRGDSLLAEFPSVVAAAQCAVKMQQELQVQNTELPASRRVEFRMGVNLGEIVVEGDQIHGDGINIAVRLEGLAEAGGICLSEVVHKQVKNRLALGYEDLGEHALKNIAEPVRVYRVQIEPRSSVLTLRDRGGVPSPPSPLPLPNEPSVAVLPFLNLSGDPEQEYFSDGITEELITTLSRFSGLFVIARTSAFTYKGKAVKVAEVSRELGVRYVVEGSVRKGGNQVRITAQLVDATTGYHLWAERYDRELQDIFLLQDEITQQIVSNLSAEVWQAEKARVRRIPPANLSAYDYLLHGVEGYLRLTREALAQARQNFERAVGLDPGYAMAYVWLGWAYSAEWIWYLSPEPQPPARWFELAQQALALDDCLPEAHRLLSEAHLWTGQHEQAMAEAERALALNPNDAYSYLLVAEILSLAGRPEEALGLAERAMRLDPRNREWYLYLVGVAYALTRRYEEAVAALKSVVTRYPNHLGAHLLLAALYGGLSQEEAARAETAAVLRLSPKFSLEIHRQRLALKDPAVLERHLAALRKAGLK
jgi:adenylate cyclase